MTSQNIFSPDQVVNLAKNQTGRAIHPFTCANRGDGNHRNVFGDLGALVPTVRGWVCPFCDYTQTWAHGFMSEGVVQNQFLRTALETKEGRGS